MHSHQSLEAWKYANQLARIGIRLARDHWKPYAAGAFSQLQCSSLSVQLNIAEGYARYSKPQFRHFLGIAYGSAIETGEILELLVQEEVVVAVEARHAIQIAVRCQRLILGLLKALREPSPT